MAYTYSPEMMAVIERLIFWYPKEARQAVRDALPGKSVLMVSNCGVTVHCGSTADLPNTVSFFVPGRGTMWLSLQVMPGGRFLPTGDVLGNPLENMLLRPPEGFLPRELLNPRTWPYGRQPKLRAAVANVLGLQRR